MKIKIKRKNFCKKAVLYSDFSQYGETEIRQLLRLKLHLFFCSRCKMYAKRNAKLSEAFKSYELLFLNVVE